MNKGRIGNVRFFVQASKCKPIQKTRQKRSQELEEQKNVLNRELSELIRHEYAAEIEHMRLGTSA